MMPVEFTGPIKDDFRNVLLIGGCADGKVVTVAVNRHNSILMYELDPQYCGVSFDLVSDYKGRWPPIDMVEYFIHETTFNIWIGATKEMDRQAAVNQVFTFYAETRLHLRELELRQAGLIL